MGWQSLETLGAGEYLFTPGGAETLIGSVVSAAEVSGSSWTLSLTPARRARVTAVSYLASETPSEPARFVWTGGFEQGNINGTTAFAPTVFDTGVSASLLTYSGSGGGDPSPEESYSFGLEVWVTPAECDEVGSATRCRVSAYDRSVIFHARMYSAEKRCLIGDFNGAISPSRSIVWSQWQTYGGAWADMSEPRIAEDGRSARLMLQSQWCGHAVIKQTVVLDNGERYVQQYCVDVLGQPMYTGDAYATGPQVVTVGALP